MAASIAPDAISRWAVANVLPDEVQAVEAIHDGPSTPASLRTTDSTAPNVCWRWKS